MVALMLELSRSNIAVWFPSLADLVFLGAYRVIGGINCLICRQEWEMPIPRRAVIREGTKPGSPVRSVGYARLPRYR